MPSNQIFLTDMPYKPYKILVLSGSFLVFFSLSAQAETTEDKAYVRCLAVRKVDPPIKREDAEACLKEAGVPDPGEHERTRTTEVWQRCLIGNASRLDDGVSPAADIARAIVHSCDAEWKAKVAARWMSPAAKQVMMTGAGRYALDEGVQAVLITRRNAKEAPRPATIRSAI